MVNKWDNSDFSGEITTAKEYNEKYCKHIDERDPKDRIRKKYPHPNEHDKFYANMSEYDRKKLAERYLNFVEYYLIYGKTEKQF